MRLGTAHKSGRAVAACGVLITRHHLDLTPARVQVEMRQHFAAYIGQAAVLILVEERGGEDVRAERKRAAVPVEALDLRQMIQVAGHQQRRIDDGPIDLLMQVDQSDILLRGHGRNKRVRGQ